MACRSCCSVYVDPVGLYSQPFQHLLHHHRRVRRAQFPCLSVRLSSPFLCPKPMPTSTETAAPKPVKAPARLLPRPSVAPSPSDPPHAHRSSLPSTRRSPISPHHPSISLSPSKPPEAALFPAHPAPRPARNSSLPLETSVSPSCSLSSPIGLRSRSTLLADKFALTHPAYW